MTNKENSINKLMALCSFIHFLTHSFTRSGCKLFQDWGHICCLGPWGDHAHS